MIDITLSLCLAAVTAGFVFKSLKHIHFILNTSTSLPYRFIVCRKNAFPKRGQLALVWHPQFGQLIKILKGVEGDVVSYDSRGRICVAGGVVGALFCNQSFGEHLYGIVPGIIPKGYVFLAGTSPRSMDSRYTKMGLVPVSMLQGRGWGFLKRSQHD